MSRLRARRRSVGLLVVAVTVSAASAAWSASPAPPVDRCAALETSDVVVPASPAGSPLSTKQDQEALALEQLFPRNTYYCQVLEAYYSDPGRTTLTRYDGYGDSSLFSAVAVAAESFRYQVMRQLERNGVDESQAEVGREDALARVEAMLDRLHFDITISKNWHGDGKPFVNAGVPPVDGDYVVAGTGGLPRFEPGYPMRSCLPAAAKYAPAPYQRRFTINDDNGVPWICEAGTSRDTYTGYFLGLLTAFDLVGPDQPRLRAQIRDDILVMVKFLMKYAWGSPRPHGRVALSPDSYDGSYTPLFTAEPFSRLWLVAAARHVAQVAGSPADATEWEAIWQATWAADSPQVRGGWMTDAGQPRSDFYKFNLTHMSFYLIESLLNDPATATALDRLRAQTLVDDFGEIDYWTRADRNAWFDAATYSIWGDRARRDESAGLLNDWIDYRRNADTGATFALDPTRCSRPAGDPQHLDCVHEDAIQRVLPNGQVVQVYDGTGDEVLTTPRPVAEQRCTDFLWQRWAGDLRGYDCRRVQYAGLDFLLPYWLLRYRTEVAPALGLTHPVYPVLLGSG